ncbi:calcipressin-1 isoform X1 [Carassius carassius]|uniref:calcipressin-1 isoform X1 n=1 Tax=Carassius carassius TaxID=217509 RepID=UPI002868D895|nr:calcipressin-1 isoform X1 [Carassius carassius]
MQQSESGGGAATSEVQLNDQPNALIACKVPEEVFNEEQLKEQFEALFRAFDPSTSFQFFKSFRRVRINFTDALTAAEARVKLHKSDFNGKEMRLYFAQSVHIGSTRLEPPKPEKQFLISPPASPPVGWAQSLDAKPGINFDLLCAVSKLGPGEQYEIHSGTTNTPSVIVHVCEDDEDSEDETAEGGKRARPKIIQTRRPDNVPSVNQ